MDNKKPRLKRKFWDFRFSYYPDAQGFQDNVMEVAFWFVLFVSVYGLGAFILGCLDNAWQLGFIWILLGMMALSRYKHSDID